MNRGVRQATVHGVAKSQTQLSDYHFLFFQLAKDTLKKGGFPPVDKMHIIIDLFLGRFYSIHSTED